MKNPLIFDTSVWIDYAGKKETPQTLLLAYYLKNRFETPLVPIVAQEFLQGIKEDAQHKKLKEILRWHTKLELPHMMAAMGAGTLYRALRKKGVTIRSGNDCVIAFYAMSFDLEVVHNDSDFDLISSHTGLKIWQNNKG